MQLCPVKKYPVEYIKTLETFRFTVIRKYEQQIITNAGKRVEQRTGRKLDSFPPVLSMPCGTIERCFLLPRDIVLPTLFTRSGSRLYQGFSLP